MFFLTALWFQYSKIFIDLLMDRQFSCEETHRLYLQLIPCFQETNYHSTEVESREAGWQLLCQGISALCKAQPCFSHKGILPHENTSYKKAVSLKTIILSRDLF